MNSVHFLGVEVLYPAALWWALLAPVVLAFALLGWRRRTREREMLIAAHLVDSVLGGYSTNRALARVLLAGAATVGIAIALIGPVSGFSLREVQRKGLDLVLCIDTSRSMLVQDLKPDRLEAAKRTGTRFIKARPTDRIGLVVYEGEAFTACPLTSDHNVLLQLLNESRSGLIEGGTAVGLGMATAVNRLRESAAKSKVIILLTDGVSNTGSVQPIDAAHIAEALGIRAYTIGVGTKGKALSPVARYPNGQYQFGYIDVDLDEPTLKEMARITGGQYFRATNEQRLREIYEEIDRLERTRFEVEQFTSRKEEFHPFALLGSALLLAGFLIDRSVLKGIA